MDSEGSVMTLTSRVKTDLAGRSLLDYLCERFPYRDAAGWRAEIAAGRLAVNGGPAEADRLLAKGDAVSYTAPRQEPAVATDIPVLYEDAWLLAVNKPAPLPVHADGVFIANTLIAILRERTGNKDLSLGHRLDRETSGVLVLAKARRHLKKLMAGFEDKTVEKRYLAVARGEAAFEETELKGWMGPKEGSAVSMRRRFSPEPFAGGQESATRFKVLQRLKGFTLLECEPLTGRTNQIRVHLEALGLPLAGDKLYGRTDEEFLAWVRHMKKGGDMGSGGPWEHPRQLLHAARMSLLHPGTGEPLLLEAATPADMAAFIQENA